MKRFNNILGYLSIVMIIAFLSCTKSKTANNPAGNETITETLLISGTLSDINGAPLVNASVTVGTILTDTLVSIKSGNSPAQVQVIPTRSTEPKTGSVHPKSFFANKAVTNAQTALRSLTRVEGVYTGTTDTEGKYSLEIPKSKILTEAGKYTKIPLNVVKSDGTSLGTITMVMDENIQNAAPLKYDDSAKLNIIASLPTVLTFQSSSSGLKYSGYFLGKGNVSVISPQNGEYDINSSSSNGKVTLDLNFVGMADFDPKVLGTKSNYIITDSKGANFSSNSIDLPFVSFTPEYGGRYHVILNITGTKAGELYNLSLNSNIADTNGQKPVNFEASAFNGYDGISYIYYSANGTSGTPEITISLDGTLGSQTNPPIQCTESAAMQNIANYSLSMGTVKSVTVGGCNISSGSPYNLILSLTGPIGGTSDSVLVSLTMNNIFKDASSTIIPLKKSFWAYSSVSMPISTGSLEFKADAELSYSYSAGTMDSIYISFSESVQTASLTTANIILKDASGTNIPSSINTAMFGGATTVNYLNLDLGKNLDNTNIYTLSLANIPNADSSKILSQNISIVNATFRAEQVSVAGNKLYIMVTKRDGLVEFDKTSIPSIKLYKMPTMPLSGTFTGTYEPFKNQLIYDPATDSTTYFEFGTYDIYTIEGEYQSLISTANPNSSKYSMISANISTLGIKATDFYFVETTGVKDTSGQALSKWTEEIYLFTSEPVKTKLDSAKVNGSDLMTSTDYDFGVFGESAWAFGVIYFGTNYGYGSSFLPSGSYKFDITGVKNLSGSSSVNINTTITVP